MRQRSIQAIFAYWSNLRGGRAAPRRSEIDPRGLAAELGDTFLLDGDSDAFRFRLAGSRIVEAMGWSLTGQAFANIWSETAQPGAAQALALAAREGEPVLLGLRVAREQQFRRSANGGLPAGDERRASAAEPGEMVLLPLLYDGRLGARLLGGLVLAREPGPMPRPMARLELAATRVLGVEARPRTPLGLIRSDLAETVLARRGHLVLLRGARDDEA